MSILIEEDLDLLWQFVREGQWIENDQRYAVPRQPVLKLLERMRQSGLLPAEEPQ